MQLFAVNDPRPSKALVNRSTTCHCRWRWWRSRGLPSQPDRRPTLCAS